MVCTFEHFDQVAYAAAAQGTDQVFFTGKMVIDRAFGVLDSLGDPIHGQVIVAVLVKYRLRCGKNELLSLVNLALFSCKGWHGKQ